MDLALVRGMMNKHAKTVIPDRITVWMQTVLSLTDGAAINIYYVASSFCSSSSMVLCDGFVCSYKVRHTRALVISLWNLSRKVLCAHEHCIESSGGKDTKPFQSHRFSPLGASPLN